MANWSSAVDTTDAELVARYRGGDDTALDELIGRYRRFARAKARGYFLIGGDRDDVEQEALIGLYKAARDFRPDHQSSFRAFADLCIKRQIITAIKTATRQKHQPLNAYQSISGVRPGEEQSETAVDEILLHHSEDDPCDTLVAAERMQWLESSMGQVLSSFEVEVLKLYVAGDSYREISERLGRHTKSIDNALQRIKRKLEGRLEDDADDQLVGVA